MTIAMAPPSQSLGAAWRETAEWVDPADATGEMLPIGAVLHRTGLSAGAVLNAIAHPRDHANRRAFLRAIARPRWNVGGEPHWAQDQIGSYFDVLADLRSADYTWRHLPRLTPGQAVRAQLASLSGMGSRGPHLRKTNLDRWKKWDGFPEPVARIDGGPSPMLLYPWRESKHLRGVLEDGLSAMYGEIDGERAEWLATALRQMTVRDWVLQHNTQWVRRKTAGPKPDSKVNLDVWLTEP